MLDVSRHGLCLFASTLFVLCACAANTQRTTAPKEENNPRAVAIRNLEAGDDKSVCGGRKRSDAFVEAHWSWMPQPPAVPSSDQLECDRLSTVWANVPDTYMRCSRDEDCMSIAGPCAPILNKRGAQALPEGPCVPPNAGVCPSLRPSCIEGCCRGSFL